MVDKLGLRTWTINLRTWIFGFECLVFKTTYVDTEKSLREGAFLFTRIALFPPLDRRNVCDKAKGLIGHFGEVYRGAERAMPYHNKIEGGTCGNSLHIVVASTGL